MATTDRVPKIKEISQAQAKGHARELLELLQDGDGWQPVLQRFGELSAGNRKAVLDAMRQDPIASGVTPDSSRLHALAVAAVRRGRSLRPEFVAALIQAALEVCGLFKQGGWNAGAELLAELLRATTKESGDGFPDVSEIDFSKLAKSETTGRTVSALLVNDKLQEVLSKTAHVWGRMVAALIATRGAACGLESEAAHAVLRLMSDPAQPVPLELVLSATWLGTIAGRMPDDLAKRSPFSSLLSETYRKTASEGASSGTSEGGASRPVAKAAGPREVFLSGVASLLDGYGADGEQKRLALSSEIGRLTMDLAANENELERTKSHVFELNRTVADLRAAANAQASEMSATRKEKAALQAEVAKWKKEVEVLLESRSNQIEHAKAECRKDFIKTTSTNFRGLRGFLIELKANDRSGTASLAATAIDEIIRVLQTQKFVTPEELPRLQSRNQGRG